MPTNDQKLITDHQKVVETIRNYDKINLINTSGEPVDEYDIEYKVKGYAIGSDGKIKISNSHRNGDKFWAIFIRTEILRPCIIYPIDQSVILSRN